MKINIAIYTAQEGYSWQSGTSLTREELKTYKECIGKFPSPDASEFPFGGIFLKDEKVVFYRYHIAAKFDFRGRNALYCVLGVLPKEDAAKVDPLTLFALPEFAAPMKPFPTEADIKESDPMLVPHWMKNLDGKNLDVRISGADQKISEWKVALKNAIEKEHSEKLEVKDVKEAKETTISHKQPVDLTDHRQNPTPTDASPASKNEKWSGAGAVIEALLSEKLRERGLSRAQTEILLHLLRLAAMAIVILVIFALIAKLDFNKNKGKNTTEGTGVESNLTTKVVEDVTTKTQNTTKE